MLNTASLSPIGTLLRLPDVNTKYLDFLQGIGIKAVQLARLSDEWLHPIEGKSLSDAVIKALAERGIGVVSLFLALSGTLIPEKDRARNMLFICRQLNWAKRYGIKLIACHAGELTPGKNSTYEHFIQDMQELAALMTENDQYFLFETGPLTVDCLSEIINDIGSSHVGINFDPANFLYYNTSEPQELINKLFDRIKLLHCKDARRPAPGEKFGQETVLGQGETQFRELLQHMLQQGFRGPLIIEREIPLGSEQRHDIQKAVGWLQQLQQQYQK